MRKRERERERESSEEKWYRMKGIKKENLKKGGRRKERDVGVRREWKDK